MSSRAEAVVSGTQQPPEDAPERGELAELCLRCPGVPWGAGDCWVWMEMMDAGQGRVTLGTSGPV